MPGGRMKYGLMGLLAAGAVACGARGRGAQGVEASERTAAAPPLYDRLGRRDAIALVVEDFVERRIARDARIRGFFAGADLPGLETKLVDQICELSGGPCKYTGVYKDMKTAHAGMTIKDADYRALVEDLVAALDQFHVAPREQQELLAALGALRDDIVTAK